MAAVEKDDAFFISKVGIQSDVFFSDNKDFGAEFALVNAFKNLVKVWILPGEVSENLGGVDHRLLGSL